MSTILQFDNSKKTAQAANEKAAQQAIDAFLKMVEAHGCRWANLTGYTPDNRMFYAWSHDLGDGTIDLRVNIESEAEARSRNEAKATS